MSKHEIINMTPHCISVITRNCTCGLCEDCLQSNNSTSEILFPRSVNPIRLEEKIEKIGYWNEVPIFKKTFLSANLPPIYKDTCYIVSSLVAQAFPDRYDFLVPNDLVRDEKGNITGCRSFASINLKIFF